MDSKNFILAFSVSFCILYIYQYFFDPSVSNMPPQQTIQQNVKLDNNVIEKDIIKPKIVKKEDSQKIEINSSSVKGFLYTLGNEIDYFSLKNYKKELNSKDNIEVLGKNRYKLSILFGSNNKVSLPNNATQWDTDGTELTPSTPVTLKWTSDEGITFEKKISIDEKFLMTVDIKIKNHSGSAVSLKPKCLISCKNQQGDDNWILHEGGVGYLSGSLKEKTFKEMNEKSFDVYSSIGGWAGLTDKYWLVALIPSQDSNCNVTFGNEIHDHNTTPALTMICNDITVNSNEEKTFRINVFAGAKELQALDYYEQRLNIKHFDLAVDYGYLYFITKPLSYLMLMLTEYARNIGIAILLITILIKLLLFPLANKSYRSMKKMKEIQPKIKQLQKVYGDDKQKLNEELFALYKKDKINPAGSCLPMIMQIPFMFALYKVMMISIEMRHAPFFGWIKDLSAPDPTSIFNLFGLLPYTVPSFLQVGAWPIIMGVTMYIQQAMSPQVSTDSTQQKMMLMLPILFTYMMSSLSVGLIIYWSFSNVLQIIQQYTIEKIDMKGKKSK